MTQNIEELLPFYANGTLDEPERAEVEAALAEDGDLRAELEVLLALREAMQADAVQSPGEFGLARLMRDVEGTEQEVTPMASPENVVPLRRLRVWQIAAALVLAAGLAQTVFVMTAPDQPGFELASGGGATQGEAAFVVGFAPGTSEAEMRDLLLTAGVEIISGPSALGLYELAIFDDAMAESAAEILRAAEGGIIDTFEAMATD
jgi:anti-sigma factor RsiW